MIEMLEQQLKQAVLDKDWESVEKLSNLLNQETDRAIKFKSAKQKYILAFLSAIVAAIVSVGTFIANLF